MPLFEWSDKFSVNIQEMDQQHKKLVGLINYLHDERQAGHDEEALGKVLSELVEYTKTHLKSEEDLLEQNDYPELPAHKEEHDNLVMQVETMHKRYYTGDINIATDVAILINDWLAEHILTKDKEYGSYLNKKGIN